MTGTGTYENPYIITTPAELYSMEDLGGADVYFALGANIDLCSPSWHSEFTPIVLNCAGFDGRGYSIRNITAGRDGGEISVFTIPQGLSELSMTGLTIENAVIHGMKATVFRSAEECTIHLHHCTFVYMMTVITPLSMGNEDGFFTSAAVTVDMELCTLAAKLVWNQQRACFRYGNVSQSQFRFDVDSTRMTSGAVQIWPLFRSVHFSDCCFFLELRDSRDTSSTKTARFASSETTFSNCYFVVHSNDPVNVYFGGSLSSVCFYDSESTGEAVINMTYTLIGSRMLALTTAQCKSAAYLRSVGFTCGGDT